MRRLVDALGLSAEESTELIAAAAPSPRRRAAERQPDQPRQLEQRIVSRGASQPQRHSNAAIETVVAGLLS